MHDACAVLRFSLRQYLHDRLTWLGLTVFVVVAGYGAADHWRSLPPRPPGGRLIVEAYLSGLSLALHIGLARDRMTRFDAFMASNFTNARNLYFTSLASGMILLTVAGMITFLVAITLSLGDIQYSVKYASLMWMLSMMLLPLVVLAELAFNSRYSLPVILFMLIVASALYYPVGDVRSATRLLGLHGELTATGVAVRVCVGVVFAATLFPVYQLRLGRTRLQR